MLSAFHREDRVALESLILSVFHGEDRAALEPLMLSVFHGLRRQGFSGIFDAVSVSWMEKTGLLWNL